MSCSIINDLVIHPSKDTGEGQNRELLGDILALLGGSFYALSNILQEYFLRDTRDTFHYLGWLGLFGTSITLIEAYCFTSDFSSLASSIK